MDYVVYLHKNPATEAVFYVGMGKRRRAVDFSKRGKRWRAYVAKHGNPVVEIHSENLTVENAKSLEIELISIFGRRGIEPDGQLVNLAQGGDMTATFGADNPRFGVRLSDETKAKIGASNRRKADEISAKLTGIKRSAETRAKIREHRLANPIVVRPMLGKRHSDSSKAKMSSSQKGKRVGSGNHKSRGVVQMDLLGKVVGTFESMHVAASSTGANVSKICLCCSGKRKSAGGFKWSYGN